MKNKKKKYILALLMFILNSPSSYAFEQNYWSKYNGIVYEGRYIIPFATLAPIIFYKDLDGFKQFILSEVITISTTELLKYAVRERRPNGSCCKSFPSGHASAVFAASSFVHFRYGFKYSIPFYLASSLVAYQRVRSKGHYVHDVIAGGLLGIASSYLSTLSFKNENGNLGITYNGKMAGIFYRKIFD